MYVSVGYGVLVFIRRYSLISQFPWHALFGRSNWSLRFMVPVERHILHSIYKIFTQVKISFSLICNATIVWQGKCGIRWSRLPTGILLSEIGRIFPSMNLYFSVRWIDPEEETKCSSTSCTIRFIMVWFLLAASYSEKYQWSLICNAITSTNWLHPVPPPIPTVLYMNTHAHRQMDNKILQYAAAKQVQFSDL